MDSTAQHLRDAYLALRCQLGEADAFRELVAEMEQALLYFAGKLLGDDDAALDVVQLTWLRVFRSVQALKRPEQLRAWLYGIVRGLAIDRIRKQDSVARLEQEYAEQCPEGEDEPTFDDEDAAAVHAGLDRLEPRLREVIVLHLLEDLAIAEVALVVGCPEGTVKSRLHRGKQKLRALLAKETP
jgi:RNA polymerase sigma-70 factor, ECF subfamily